MRWGAWAIAGPLIWAATPACAGEEVLYGPPPAWVEPYDKSKLDLADSKPLLLYDVQQRIEGDTLTVYVDRAFKLATPEALTQLGTIQALWLPDQGDLTIHTVEILRGGQAIDVLADGTRYTVLRRERQLERRQIDGVLTATMPVPGLQIGDVLHITFSQTASDKALQGKVQLTTPLLMAPTEAQFARTTLSWPDGEQVRWSAGPEVAGASEEVRGGIHYVTVPSPLPKRAELPDAAPSRFTRMQILQAGTFKDWAQVSRTFASLFAPEAAIAPGGELAAEAERIRKSTSDPLVRMAMATRLVQDKISYLANGMSGGNYVPQSPQDTWRLRYGDCKAKTYLLLSLLNALGIEAEPFLVNSSAGDAVPDFLPMPGAFDHVIVRAQLDGKVYWLDGTMSGTRLSNLADTPPFHYGLPLTAAGSDLEKIEPRIPALPLAAIDLTLDERGGVELPVLVTYKARLSGVLGSGLNVTLKQANAEQRKQVLQSYAAQFDENMVLLEESMSYDEDSGIGEISIRGVSNSPWAQEGGRQRQSFTQLDSTNVSFDYDRARPAWRDIPVALSGPNATETKLTVLLPEHEEGYRLGGRTDLDMTFAHTRIVRKAALEGNVLTVDERMESLGGELPAAEIAAEKAKAARIAGSSPFLLAPPDAVLSTEMGKPELHHRVIPYEKAYAAAIEREPRKAISYLNRALFRWNTTDLDGALADYDKVIEIDPTPDNYASRAHLHETRDEPEKALADYRKAFEISPSNDAAMRLAQMLGELGHTEEALQLVDEFDDYGDYHEAFVQTRADILAFAGRGEEGLAEIDGLIQERPDKAGLLNASCWYRARFGIGMDGMMDVCNRAVEQTQTPAEVLDSRALAWLRLGEFARAKADADAVLAMAGDFDQTRYIRGFAMRGLGEAAGEDDIAYLARSWPGMATQYERYGLKP